MFYLGIDIAKNTHVASLIDEKGKNIFKGFSFSNSTDGGKSLLEIIKKHVDFSDVTVGVEATGHYWLSIYSFIYDYDFHSIWKQWKKCKTKRENLMKLGINEKEARQQSGTRKSYWRLSDTPTMHRALSNKTLERLGYLSLSSVYC